MIDRRSPCTRHRFALEAFVDRREVGPTTAAALAHMEICPACEAEVERIALAVVALRRLGTDAHAASAAIGGDGADGATGTAGWSTLRARVDRARAPVWRWRTQLGSVLVAAGIVAAAIGPTSIQRGGTGTGVLDEAVGGPSISIDPARRDELEEQAWMRKNQRARKEYPTEAPTVDVRINPGIYGEEARPLPRVTSPSPGPTRR